MTIAHEQEAAPSRPSDLPAVTHWIDGAATAGHGRRTADVYDPATGRRTKSVELAAPEDVDAAVASAKRAFPAWRDTSLAGRTGVIFKFRELLNQRKAELAEVITAEHGKVLS